MFGCVQFQIRGETETQTKRIDDWTPRGEGGMGGTGRLGPTRIHCCCLITKLCPALLCPHGLEPNRLLYRPAFPGTNTRVGCQSLLQGIFLTRGLDPRLLHRQADSLPPSHQRSPHIHCCFCGSVAQSCPTLCGPVDCSLPGSSVHGLLQARVLEWFAMPSSSGSF